MRGAGGRGATVRSARPLIKFQIAAELRRRGAQAKVLHLADFLAQAFKAEEQA